MTSREGTHALGTRVRLVVLAAIQRGYIEGDVPRYVGTEVAEEGRQICLTRERVHEATDYHRVGTLRRRFSRNVVKRLQTLWRYGFRTRRIGRPRSAGHGRVAEGTSGVRCRDAASGLDREATNTRMW